MVEELKSQMRKLENLIGCKGKVDVTSRAFTKELIRALEEKYKSDLKSSVRLRRLEFYHDLIENARLRQKKSRDIEEKFVMSEKKEKEKDEDEENVEKPVKIEEEIVQAVDGDDVVVKAEEIDEWKDLMTLAKIYYLLEHPNSEGLSWKRRITKKKSIKKFTDKDLIEWYVAQHFRLKGLEEWALSRQEARKLNEKSPYNFDDLLEDDESRELEDMFHVLETQKQSKHKASKLEKALDAKRPFRYTDECMEDWTESYSDDSEESGADKLFDQILDISDEPGMKFDVYAPGQKESSIDEDMTEIFSTHREIPKYRNPIFEEMDETETMEEWYSLCDEVVGTTKKSIAPPKIVFSFDGDETSDGSLQRPQGTEVIEYDFEEYDIDEEMELFLDDEDYSSDKTLSDKESSDIEGKEPKSDEFDQKSKSAATEEVDDGTISRTDEEASGKTPTIRSMEDPDLNQATFIIGKSDPPGGIDSSNVQKRSISLADEEAIQKDISSIIEEAKGGALDETAAILASTDDADYEDKENVGTGKNMDSIPGISEKSVKQVESATTAVEKETAKEIKSMEDESLDKADFTMKKTDVSDESPKRSMEDPDLNQATFIIGKSDSPGGIDSSNVQERSISLADEEAIQKDISSIIEEAKGGALDETAAILASTHDKETVISTGNDVASIPEISHKSSKEVESATATIEKATAKDIKSMEDKNLDKANFTVKKADVTDKSPISSMEDESLDKADFAIKAAEITDEKLVGSIEDESLDKANFTIKRADIADEIPERSMEDEDLDQATFIVGKSDPPTGIDMTQTRGDTVNRVDEKGLEDEIKSMLDEARDEALDLTVSIVTTEDVVEPKSKTDERHKTTTTNQSKTDETNKAVTEDAKDKRKQSIKALIDEAKDMALDKTISKIVENEGHKTTTTNQPKTSESNKAVTEDDKEEKKQ